MRKSLKLAVLGCLTAAIAGSAVAQSAENALKARKGHMQLYAFNLGPLGAMAKGELDYNAEMAAGLASTLATLTQLDQSRYWPPGSADGELAGSRALPAIWENPEDVMAKSMALNEAVVALSEAAGTDLESLRAAMGPVGQACGACHEDYRTPQ